MARQICRMTGLPKNNISRGVQKLEKKGLVSRSPDPKDARRALMAMTETGRHLFDELLAAYTKRADGILTLLDDDDRADLNRILVKLSKFMTGVA